MKYQRLFFRILYGGIYVLLILILVGLLLITPGDAIERSISNGQNYNVLIVTISYVTTVVIVVFVYVLRLYITKTAIAAIPKTWAPISKSDFKDAIYRMVHTGLTRSAVIAYEARPREQTGDPDHSHAQHGFDHEAINGGNGRAKNELKRTKTAAEDLGLPLPPKNPPWGEIEHSGWASPNSPDLRNVQYSSVLLELPNLIEAKALTLAPTIAASGPGGPSLDPEAIALLQRMPNMSMRDYLDHLTGTGVIIMDETTSAFVSGYEFARFSNQPLSNEQFRELMHLFAEILRNMQPPDQNVLTSTEEVNDGWGQSESDIDNDAPLDTNPPSPRSSSFSRRGTSFTQSSLRPHLMRNSSAHSWSFRTAPNTLGSMRTGMLSRKSSDNSIAQSQRRYPASQLSSSSMRSKAVSGGSSSSDSGSVIRLATSVDDGSLPYVLNLRPTAEG